VRARSAAPAALVAIALGLVMASACTSFEHLTDAGPGGASAADCGECHVAVYAEWRASTHAASWDNEAFVTTTSGRLFDDCLGCHAPDTVFVEGPPACGTCAGKKA